MAEKDPHQTNNTCSAEDINPILCAECGVPMYSEKIDNLGDCTIASFCTKCGYTAFFTGTDENNLIKVGDITLAPSDYAKEVLDVYKIKCTKPGCDGKIEAKTRTIHYGATRTVNSSIVFICNKCHGIYEIFEPDDLTESGEESDTKTMEELDNENNLSH